MPRKAQGTTFVARGARYASVIIAPKKRLARSLDGLVTTEDERAGLAWAGALQALVDGLRAAGRASEIEAKIDAALEVGRADKTQGLARVTGAADKLRAQRLASTLAAPLRSTSATTFRAFAKKWTSGDLHREFPDHVPEKKTAGKDAGLLAKYVYPILGPLPLRDIKLRHCQDVLRGVPLERSSAVRRQVAQVMVRVLNLAVYPAELLPSSPIPKGFLPKVRVRPGAYLYPAEDRALLACKKVPLVNRLLYGFLAREGMRREEALGLEWTDVDLERGAVRLDENKTDDPRAWALDAGTAKALAWWRRHAPTKGGKVFADVVDAGHLADALRTHLREAKVTRPELYEHSGKRRQFNVHGLRATFVTLALANGKSETWVQDRTGHRSSIMVNRYRRIARTAAELGLGPLDALDKAIPELRKARRTKSAA
jgi:integrase